MNVVRGFSVGVLLLFVILFIFGCANLDKPQKESRQSVANSTPFSKTVEPKLVPSPPSNPQNTNPQIAEYIRVIFQDKNNNFWFGTNGYGVAHYNGDSISYFSIQQGFNGYQITGITEDTEKNIWFSTDQGVVKYDWTTTENGQKKFMNYTDQLYFGGQRFWSIFADRKGNVWAGGSKGVFLFNGSNWSEFKLPLLEPITGDFITKITAWSIIEDHNNDIWISTNGYGAFKYDGKSFTQLSKKDGLTDNSIDVIIQDSKNRMWFGTRFGGVSRYDGNTFTNFTAQDSIGNDEVCSIFEDKDGNIWMSSEGYGVYCYDGEFFKNYRKEEGLGVRAVQAIFQDREGKIWVGGGGGLYRFENDRFINITKAGPW